jgi:hypothetical protein
MLKRSRSLLGAAAVGLVLALLMAACGESDTPTPTATAPPLPPLTLLQESLASDILAQFPETEQECINQALGDQAYGEFRETTFVPVAVPEHLTAFFQCIGQDSAARLYIAFGTVGSQGISDETYNCMRDTLADFDVLSVLSGEAQQEFVMLVGTILCLNDLEAEQVQVNSFPAATESGEVSLVQMRCVAEEVGVTNMVGVLIQALGTVELPQEVFTAVEECGVQLLPIAGSDGTGPDDNGQSGGFSLTPEHFQCLRDALESQVLIDLQSGERQPTSAEAAVLVGCGVEP